MNITWMIGAFAFIIPALHFFIFFIRLIVILGPPLLSLTVQLLDPFPCRVEFVRRYPMNSSIRAETVLRETLPGTIRAAVPTYYDDIVHFLTLLYGHFDDKRNLMDFRFGSCSSKFTCSRR